MSGRTLWGYARTVLPAWIAGLLLSYVSVRMGLSEQYRLALIATGVFAAVLALNPGLQALSVGFLAPLVIVLGFYSQWIPSMVEGHFSPRQETFLGALDLAIVAFAVAFLVGSVKSAARIAIWLSILFVATYLLATYSGSAGRASQMVDWFQATLNLDHGTALRYTIIARKSIHVTFYALVAWSAYWSAWHGSLRGVRGFLYGAAIALILASFDESRQLGSPGRGGSGWDVLLDMSGATSALIIAALFAAGRARRQDRRPVSPLLETTP